MTSADRAINNVTNVGVVALCVHEFGLLSVGITAGIFIFVTIMAQEIFDHILEEKEDGR